MFRRRGRGQLFTRARSDHSVVDGYRTTSWAPSFTPSLEDVRTVRRLLASKPASSGRLLPNELILSVLDHAQYYPIVVSERNEDLDLVSAQMPYHRTQLYLVGETPSIAREGETLKVIDLRFTIQARDQGWTTEDNRSLRNSSSFFEASILRPDDPADPVPVAMDFWQVNAPPELESSLPQGPCFNRDYAGTLVQRAALPERACNTDLEPQWEGSHSWFLQANMLANKSEAIHEVVWGRQGTSEGGEGAGKGEGFVEMLRPGDRIIVWVRATRMNWANKVKSVKMEVRYTIL